VVGGSNPSGRTSSYLLLLFGMEAAISQQIKLIIRIALLSLALFATIYTILELKKSVVPSPELLDPSSQKNDTAH
jgi:hypothetical protein